LQPFLRLLPRKGKGDVFEQGGLATSRRADNDETGVRGEQFGD